MAQVPPSLPCPVPLSLPPPPPPQAIAEKQSVEVIRSCLDVFVQRISVTQEVSQRSLLQLWYESLSQMTNAAVASSSL
jgi:hypothetical protein